VPMCVCVCVCVCVCCDVGGLRHSDRIANHSHICKNNCNRVPRVAWAGKFTPWNTKAVLGYIGEYSQPPIPAPFLAGVHGYPTRPQELASQDVTRQLKLEHAKEITKMRQEFELSVSADALGRRVWLEHGPVLVSCCELLHVMHPGRVETACPPHQVICCVHRGASVLTFWSGNYVLVQVLWGSALNALTALQHAAPGPRAATEV
jgi:hypothetical protein